MQATTLVTPHTTDFEAILQILTDEFGDLSFLRDDDIVAGQAVASAYLRLHGYQVFAPMKDLDVFSSDIGERGGAATPINGERTGVPAIIARTGSMGDEVLPVQKGQYWVEFSLVEGRINWVNISPQGTQQFTAMHLLDGFDVNCAMAALDIQNRSVVLHPAFEEFCVTRQIKAVNYFTPASTAVRLLKKAQEIKGAYFDEATELAKIQMAVWVTDPSPNYYRRGQGISKRRFESLDEPLQNTLLRYFSVEQIVKNEIELAVFVPRAETFNSGVRAFVEDFKAIALAYDAPWAGGGLQLFFDRYLNQLVCGKSLVIDKSEPSKRLGFLLWALKFPHIPFEHVAWAKLIRLCAKHPVVAAILGLAQDAAHLNSLLQRLVYCDNHYPEIFGQLETGRIACEGFDALFPHIDDLTRHAKAFFDAMKANTVERSLADFTTKGVEVHQITNELELIQLGHREKHCVGGYWWAIESGHSLIFTLLSSQGASTLQVTYLADSKRRFRKGRFRISHHLSKESTPPPALHVEAENTLRRRLDWCFRTTISGVHWYTPKDLLKALQPPREKKPAWPDNVQDSELEIPF